MFPKNETHLFSGSDDPKENISIVNFYKNLFLAAALGCMMEFFSVTEKVTNGKEIRNYLEKALEKDPKDGSAHYIFGRFHYEASNLPWAVSETKFSRKLLTLRDSRISSDSVGVKFQ